ncbi:unnamed protein product [Xylocopa violacea]|uniref:Dolichyldiphosphatase n=1 Tax=Xylocopa violacea TaxID=135666 RepID=A0ABP1N0X6_XYLVO
MASLDDDSLHKVKSSFIDAVQKSEWVPLSLTLVEYPQGDFFGKLLALISLIPFAIIAGFITLILFRRDLHTITFFSGIIINECINFILKHTICEARPMTRDTVHVEYGMPSMHAQFMWFFATYTTLFICMRRISEYLLLRDTTLIPNILWFEYTNIRTEARARSRKLVSMKSQ